jgi:hypothetical protein
VATERTPRGGRGRAQLTPAALASPSGCGSRAGGGMRHDAPPRDCNSLSTRLRPLRRSSGMRPPQTWMRVNLVTRRTAVPSNRYQWVGRNNAAASIPRRIRATQPRPLARSGTRRTDSQTAEASRTSDSANSNVLLLIGFRGLTSPGNTSWFPNEIARSFARTSSDWRLRATMCGVLIFTRSAGMFQRAALKSNSAQRAAISSDVRTKRPGTL